jgi:hypothetical protein
LRENSINSYKKRDDIKNLCIALTIPSLVILGLMVDYYYGMVSNYILCATGLLSCTLIGILLTFVEIIAWYNRPNTSPRSLTQHKDTNPIQDHIWIHQPGKTHEMG